MAGVADGTFTYTHPDDNNEEEKPDPKRYEGDTTVDGSTRTVGSDHNPASIKPPPGVSEHELFKFPGINWLEFYRDSVLAPARDHLKTAHSSLAPLTVEPGNFDQANSIRKFFSNIKRDCSKDLEILDEAMTHIQTTLTGQAAKYKKIDDANKAKVEDLGEAFRQAGALMGKVKPINSSMPDPEEH